MHKKKIMIVDDDVVFAEELKDVLQSGGYDTLVECDPTAVVEAIRYGQPQVVLLDINMPKKSGFDVANDLLYGKTECKATIIIMTGYYKPSFDQAFRLLGINKCLHKPFTLVDLVTMIESI